MDKVFNDNFVEQYNINNKIYTITYDSSDKSCPFILKFCNSLYRFEDYYMVLECILFVYKC